MKTEPKRIVESQGAPNENDLWLDTGKHPVQLKSYLNGEWIVVCGEEDKQTKIIQK